jgi:hypothetical protein
MEIEYKLIYRSVVTALTLQESGVRIELNYIGFADQRPSIEHTRHKINKKPLVIFGNKRLKIFEL